MASVEETTKFEESQIAPPRNRADRRRVLLSPQPKKNYWIETYDSIASGLKEVTALTNSVMSNCENDLTKIVYQGQPFAIDNLDLRRRLHFFLDRADEANSRVNFAKEENLAKIREGDLYPIKISGTSLLDIENMPYPLSTENISRINKMLFNLRIFNLFQPVKETITERVIRQSILFLASQKFARPEEKIEIPGQIYPLYLRLVDYFDYYTRLLNNFSENPQAEDDFYFTLATGIPRIPQSLGCYVPGRLGITPSSTIKLIHERAYKSNVLTFLWGSFEKNRGVARYLSFGAKNAARERILPDSIAGYQFYDSKNEQEAGRFIQDKLRGHSIDNNELLKIHKLAESYLDKLAVTKEAIIRDIRRSTSDFLVISLPQSDLIDTVTLASQYKQTLMIILRLKNRSHLTLEYAENNPSEIDREDHLYGIPVEIIKKGSHMRDFIINESLQAIFGNLAIPFVVREERQVPLEVVENTQAKPSETLDQPITFVPTPSIKFSKIKRRIPAPIAQVLSLVPPLPEPGAFSQKRFHVLYSEDEIHDNLGRRTDRKTVERISESLGRFEMGWEKVKIIDWSGGKRYVFRVGDLRVVLNHLGNGEFLVDGVGDRKYIYRNYGDFKV